MNKVKILIFLMLFFTFFIICNHYSYSQKTDTNFRYFICNNGPHNNLQGTGNANNCYGDASGNYYIYIEMQHGTVGCNNGTAYQLVFQSCTTDWGSCSDVWNSGSANNDSGSENPVTYFTRKRSWSGTRTHASAGTYFYRVAVLVGSSWEYYYWRFITGGSYRIDSHILNDSPHSGVNGGETVFYVTAGLTSTFRNNYAHGNMYCDGSTNQAKIEIYRDTGADYSGGTLWNSCSGPANDGMGLTMGCNGSWANTLFTTAGTYYYKVLTKRGASTTGQYNYKIIVSNPIPGTVNKVCNGNGQNYFHSGVSGGTSDCYDGVPAYNFSFNSSYTNISYGCQNLLVTELYNCGTDTTWTSCGSRVTFAQLSDQTISSPTASFSGYGFNPANGGLFFWLLRDFYNATSGVGGSGTADGTYRWRVQACNHSGQTVKCCNTHSDCQTYWGLGTGYFCTDSTDSDGAYRCEPVPTCYKPDTSDNLGLAFVSSYKVYNYSTGAEVDATSTSLACDGSVDYYGTNGQCTYSRRYAECNGSGSCDTNSATFYQGYTDNVPANKVALTQSGGSTVPTGDATSTSLSCDYSVDYYGTNGQCTYSRRYAECNGSGSCDTNSVTNYQGYTDNVPANKVALTQSGGATVPTQDATSQSLACDGDTNYNCTNGACSGNYRYSECNGSGSCDNAATTYYQQYNVVAQTGYTLTATCVTNGTTLCGYGSWSCVNIYDRVRDQYRCNASQVCNYDVGDEYESCVEIPYYYCSSGNCVYDSEAPTCTLSSISKTASGSYIFVNGSTVYYNSAESGRFSVNVTSTDSQSGVQLVNYPALSTLLGSGNDTVSPYQSNDANQAYGFTSSSTYNGSASFTCYDNVGRLASNNYTIRRDSNNPVYDSSAFAFGGCDYVSGNDCWERANSNFTINLRHTDGQATDSGPYLQYLAFTAGCIPNGCGGAPSEIKSYIDVNVAPSGFTDWMANDSFLNITGGTCIETGGCTGASATIQWAMTTGSASEAVYTIYTFMYDEVFRGVGYTDTGKYLKIDFTPPTGGSISYTNGDDPTPVTLTLSAGTDSKSGVKTGAGSATIERRSVAVNSDGTCPTVGWSGWSTLTTINSSSPSYDDNAAGGNCYQYRYVVQDNVGNSTTYTSANTAIVPGSANRLEVSGGLVVSGGGALNTWSTCGSYSCSSTLSYKPATVLYGTTYLRNIDDNGNPSSGQWAWDTTNKWIKIADNPSSASLSYDSLLVRMNLFDSNYVFTANDAVGVQLEWSGDNDSNITTKTIVANSIGGSNGGNTTSGNLSFGRGTFVLTAVAGSSGSTGSFRLRVCYPNCTSPTIQSSTTIFVQKPTQIYLPISDVSDSGAAPSSNQTFFNPVFSPDGSKLAFLASGTNVLSSCGTGTETGWNLYVKQVSGGSTCKRLTNNAQKLLPISELSFGTDNNTVYYSRLSAQKTVNIWSVNFSTVASSSWTNASTNEGYFDPDVCSSGGNIVAIRSTTSGNSIVVMSGGVVTKALTDGSTMLNKNVVLKPRWSPDCSKVAFAMWDMEEDSSITSAPSNTGVYVLSNLGAANALDYAKLNNCQNNGKDETAGFIYCLRVSDYKNNGNFAAFFPNWTKDGLGVIYSIDKGNGFDVYRYINWSDMTGYQFGVGKTTNFDVYIQYIGDTNIPPYQVIAKSDYSEYSMVQNRNDGKMAFISKNIGTTEPKGTGTLEVLTLSNENTISSAGGILFFNGMITAVFPVGVTKTDLVKIQVTNPTGTPSAAYDNMVSTGEAREFAPGGVKFDTDIRLIFHYCEDGNGNAYINQVSCSGSTVDEKKLHVYYYCTASGAAKGYCSSSGSWVRYDGINDPVANTITIFTNHFSRYDLFAARSGVAPLAFTPLKIDNLHTYPNPWMPGSAGEITFNADNVEYTQGQILKVNIDIYDLRGKLVKSTVKVIPPQAGIQPAVFGGIDLATWNVKNNAGRQVASGVYFYVLRATDGITSAEIKGKLGIVR